MYYSRAPDGLGGPPGSWIDRCGNQTEQRYEHEQVIDTATYTKVPDRIGCTVVLRLPFQLPIPCTRQLFVGITEPFLHSAVTNPSPLSPNKPTVFCLVVPLCLNEPLLPLVLITAQHSCRQHTLRAPQACLAPVFAGMAQYCRPSHSGPRPQSSRLPLAPHGHTRPCCQRSHSGTHYRLSPFRRFGYRTHRLGCLHTTGMTPCYHAAAPVLAGRGLVRSWAALGVRDAAHRMSHFVTFRKGSVYVHFVHLCAVCK